MEGRGWRDNRTAVGIILCGVIFGLGFLIAGNIGLYFNLIGFLIVAGGTLGATLIGFSTRRLMILYMILKRSFQVPVRQPHEIVEILVDLSVKSKIRGILSLEEDEGETSLLFLRRALGLLVDGYKAEQISEILTTEMYFFKVRRAESERVLRTMADLCPSFGIVGSIIGLIGMIAGSADTSTILSTIPIALTSTLYGIVLTNFFFRPFEAKIQDRTNQELLLQKIIVEGIMAIATELNPRILEAKLKSFLTPSSRNGKLVSLRRIQEKFKIRDTSSGLSLSQTPTAELSESL
ncbi:MAG: flagellar motor protein MotA [Thermoplasmata archaeon]|nr:MAG: flagellar motor protein MotA [Thermoplasmata archaeon]